MDQITKEEIIEYFIEQLGDNEILGRFMTIEQIREKLNNMISEVTYEKELGNCVASWYYKSDGRGSVNFDITKMLMKDRKTTIVHELLHVLTTSSYNFPYIANYKKFGLDFSCESLYSSDSWNTAINEGMTTTLAEQITGESSDAYMQEKNFYNILSAIIGEDNMLKIFFEDIEQADCKSERDFERKTKDIFKEDLLKQYGPEFGTEINDDVKKVLSLTDQLNILNSKDGIYGLNLERIKLQNQIEQEIDDTLLSVLERIANHEADIDKKVEVLRVIGKYCKYSAYSRALKEFFDSNNMSYEQRMEILEKISKKVYIPYEIVKETLFELPEALDMDAELKLKKYFDLRKTEIAYSNSDECQTVYEAYVKAGRIKEDIFCKKDVFSKIMFGCYNMQGIDARLTDIKYQNIGNFYRICGEYGSVVGTFYDQDGKNIKPLYLSFDPLNDEHIPNSDLIGLAESIPKEKVKLIEEQIKNKFRQYQIKDQGENVRCQCKIEVIDNIFRLLYSSRGRGKKVEEFFEIDDNGQFRLIPVRGRKKIKR